MSFIIYVEIAYGLLWYNNNYLFGSMYLVEMLIKDIFLVHRF